MKRQIPFLALCLLFASTCFASSAKGSQLEQPKLEQLDWLTGCWTGTGLGGEVDECWTRAGNERFTGVFQMKKDGQQQFSEIVMIADIDGVWAMRVKHFDTAFKQWASDKSVGVSFPFVEMGEDFIQFEGLRYELIDDDLHVTLDMKDGDEIHKVGFKFTRN